MIRKIKIVFLIELVIGLASGIVIGSVFIALLTILGVIPRLMQLSRAKDKVNGLIVALLLGTFVGTFFSFSHIFTINTAIIVPIWGFIHGIFNGMLAAGLVETLNVFPIVARRLQVEHYLFMLMMALVLGKVVGSIVQWLIL